MVKYLLVLIMIFTFSQLTLAQNYSKLSYKDKNVLLIDSSSNRVIEEKSPALAGFLSFIVPGVALGQLYNGQYLNTGIRIMVSLISVIWFFNSAHLIDTGGGREGAWQPFVAFSIFTANWLSSVVDAVISANSINKHIRSKNKYLRKDMGFNLNMGYRLRNLGLRLTYNF